MRHAAHRPVHRQVRSLRQTSTPLLARYVASFLAHSRPGASANRKNSLPRSSSELRGRLFLSLAKQRQP